MKKKPEKNAFMNLHLRFDKCTLPIEEQNLQKEIDLEEVGGDIVAYYQEKVDRLEAKIAKLSMMLADRAKR